MPSRPRFPYTASIKTFRQWAALGSPWVDEIDVVIGKIIDIPCRELCSTDSGNGGDSGIAVGDALADSAAMRRHPHNIPGRAAFKTENGLWSDVKGRDHRAQPVPHDLNTNAN